MSTTDHIVKALSRRPIRVLARPMMRRRATVFMLHRERNDASGTLGHTQDELRTAIRRLRDSGAQFLSLRDLVDHGRRHGSFPSDAVAFTIDDGFADHGNLARALVAEGVPVTIFLITGLMDGQSWPWDDQVGWALRACTAMEARVRLPDGDWSHSLATPADRLLAVTSLQNQLKVTAQDDLEAILRRVFEDLGVEVPAAPPPAFQPLGWDEARALERLGVDFGPHSVSHRIFSRIGDAAARSELVESCRRLRDELDRPLDIFAWPTGRPWDFTTRDRRLARELGLRACVATADDYATIDPAAGEDCWYGLRRFSLPTHPRHLLQYGSWIERAKQIARAPLERLSPR